MFVVVILVVVALVVAAVIGVVLWVRPVREKVVPPVKEAFGALWAVIREHYYHPAFHGSFSLKHVLPVLVPDMGYQDLAIQEGGTASQEYLRMIDPGRSPAEKSRHP